MSRNKVHRGPRYSPEDLGEVHQALARFLEAGSKQQLMAPRHPFSTGVSSMSRKRTKILCNSYTDCSPFSACVKDLTRLLSPGSLFLCNNHFPPLKRERKLTPAPFHEVTWMGQVGFIYSCKGTEMEGRKTEKSVPTHPHHIHTPTLYTTRDFLFQL